MSVAANGMGAGVFGCKQVPGCGPPPLLVTWGLDERLHKEEGQLKLQTRVGHSFLFQAPGSFLGLEKLLK